MDPIAYEREWHVNDDGTEIHYLRRAGAHGNGICSKIDLTNPEVLRFIVEAWNKWLDQ